MVKFLSVLLISLLCQLFLLKPSLLIADTFRLDSILVEGNYRVSDEAVVNYSRLKVGETISSENLNDAYNNVLNTGLFSSVEFKQLNKRVIIIVGEYSTVNEISFEGNTKFTDEKLLSFISIKPRFVFSPAALEEDLSSLTNVYRNSGRVTAKIKPKIIKLSDNRVNVIFEIYEGDQIEIERISFVGNRSFRDSRLRRVLESKQAGPFRRLVSRDVIIDERISFDKKLLTEFYLSRGFVDFKILDVNAELSEEKDAYFVSYNVQEGPKFKVGKISVSSNVKDISPSDLKKSIGLDTGQVYSPAIIQIEASKLETEILSLGHRFIKVSAISQRNMKDLSQDVEFLIEKSDRLFVERIDIYGNIATFDRVIRRQFFINEGDPFNPREIRAATERIRALGLFSEVEVKINAGSNSSQVIVEVEVKEQPTGTLSFGAGYSSASGLGGIIEYAEKNFIGRGQSLSLSLKATSGDQLYDLSFYEPMFLRNNLGFGVNFSVKDTEKQNAAYDTKYIRVRPLVTYPLGEKSKIQIEYLISQTELSNPGAVGALITAEVNEGKVTSSSIGYQYSHDTRLYSNGAKSGLLLNFGQNFSGLGGDKTSLKTTFKAAAETNTLNEELKLTAVLEAGILSFTSGNSRVLDRFFLGSNKMRGFEPDGIGPRECPNKQCNNSNDDALGGERFGVVRFEAEFPLGLPEEYGFSGGLYYDIGNVWSLNRVNNNVLYEEGVWRQVVGATIFWKTPIGPLRFNFSETLKKAAYDKDESFDLTISTRF